MEKGILVFIILIIVLLLCIYASFDTINERSSLYINDEIKYMDPVQYNDAIVYLDKAAVITEL